jgi:hypothetical protein
VYFCRQKENNVLMKQKRIYFFAFLIAFVFNSLYCNAGNVEKIIVTFGSVVGYGVQIHKAKFNNKGRIFKLEEGRGYGTNDVPSVIQSEDVYNLLDSINARKCASAKGLWGFSDDDISKCITWLKDTTIDDADLEIAIYRISKSDCLKFLARPDAKEILNEKCINIRFYHGTLFDITFIFSDGNELVIKPQSLYKGAYWLVGKDNYVRNDVVTPFLEKMQLYSLNWYGYEDYEAIIGVIGLNKEQLLNLK